MVLWATAASIDIHSLIVQVTTTLPTEYSDMHRDTMIPKENQVQKAQRVISPQHEPLGNIICPSLIALPIQSCDMPFATLT